MSIEVKKEDITLYPDKATIKFLFTYKGVKGECEYLLFDQDDEESEEGIIYLKYLYPRETPLHTLIHNWIEQHIIFEKKIIIKE